MEVAILFLAEMVYWCAVQGERMRWYFFQMAVAILIGWVCISAGLDKINGVAVGIFMVVGSLAVTGIVSWSMDLLAKLRRRTGNEQ